MPDLEFLITGKTSSNSLDVRYVRAASAADAMRRLEEGAPADLR